LPPFMPTSTVAELADVVLSAHRDVRSKPGCPALEFEALAAPQLSSSTGSLGCCCVLLMSDWCLVCMAAQCVV
jgi:hypothetical protein